jgi:hypothetical protein
VASDRLFTVDEVNDLIPRLEVLMEQLQRHGRTLRAAIAELAAALGQPAEKLSTQELLERRPELRAEAAEIQRLLAEIETCGGELKGLDLGLVDFPAEKDGEIVLLCWQYGEREVTHYHSFDGGFSGRKPLDPRRERPDHLQ